MEKSYFEHALEIVKGQAQTKPMTAEEIISMAKNLAGELEAMDNPVPAAPVGPSLIAGFDPKKAIGDDFIVSGLDGQPYKILTQRHFEKYGTNAKAYREMCGYAPKQSLACKALMKFRRDKMKDMKLWERKGGAKPAEAAADAAY